jgi:hypothetical protein
MTIFLHALILGYGVAALGAIGLSDAGLSPWAAVLAAWIGGNVLALAFAAAGAMLWPEKPARRASFTATADEFRLWDEDLARDLIDAEVRPPEAAVAGVAPAAPVAAPETGRRAAG